jgi:hypothetical protein
MQHVKRFTVEGHYAYLVGLEGSPELLPVCPLQGAASGLEQKNELGGAAVLGRKYE